MASNPFDPALMKQVQEVTTKKFGKPSAIFYRPGQEDGQGEYSLTVPEGALRGLLTTLDKSALAPEQLRKAPIVAAATNSNTGILNNTLANALTGIAEVKHVPDRVGGQGRFEFSVEEKQLPAAAEKLADIGFSPSEIDSNYFANAAVTHTWSIPSNIMEQIAPYVSYKRKCKEGQAFPFVKWSGEMIGQQALREVLGANSSKVTTDGTQYIIRLVDPGITPAALFSSPADADKVKVTSQHKVSIDESVAMEILGPGLGLSPAGQSHG